MILLLLDNFTKSDKTHPYILIHISNHFQTLGILEKKFSNKNEPYQVRQLANVGITRLYMEFGFDVRVSVMKRYYDG